MKNDNATETILTPVDTELEKFFKLPEVYAFRHEMFPNGLKVGFSLYGDNRLGQWDDIYPGLEVVKRYPTLLDDGKFFTDHPVHGKLIKNGKRRITREEFPKDTYYSCEFFDDTTGDDVENAVNEVKSDFANGTELHKCKDINTAKFIGKHYKRNENLVYDLRKMQKKIVENFLNAIEHNATEMLCVAPCRGGKCASAMFCAKELKSDSNKVIVVVSAKVDVKDEWQRVVEIPMNFDGYYFLDGEDLNANSNVIAETKKKGNVVIFLSLQDLKGKDVKKKHKELLKTHVDLLIVDETHFAARAPEYGEVLRKKDNDIDLDTDEKDDSISKDVVCKYIKAKYWLHLTATPDATILDEFNRPYQIIGYFTDKDLIDERDEWSFENECSENPKSENESPYAGLPNNMFIVNDLYEAMKDMPRSSSSFLNDLFETKSTNEKGDYKHFVRDEYVMLFLHMLDGSISVSDLNVLSFFSNVSIKKNGLGKHIVFQLPRCAACDAMMELIQNNLHTFKNLKKFEFINLAGLDNEFKNAKAFKDKIDELDFEGKNTITFTVKRCLTGNTIPAWDTIMFLSDVLSYKEYYQAVGRLKSSNIRSFKDGNGDIMKQIMKFQTICIDFNPYRAFSMLEEKARIQATANDKGGNDGILEELKTELKTVPMVFYGGLKLSEVQPVEVMEKLREYSRKTNISDDVKFIEDNMNHIIFDSKVIRDISKKYKDVIIKRGKKSESFSPFKKETTNGGENNDNTEDVNDNVNPTVQNEDNQDVRKQQENPQETETTTENDRQVDDNGEADNNKKDQNVIGFMKFIETICFFAILTDNKVISLKGVIDAISTNEDDMRKATHIGLDVNDVINTYDELLHHNAKDLHGKIDNAIMNTNSILNDSESISVEEKMKILLTKFGRISENEVVLPNHKAKDMMTLVFDNADNVDDLNILDVSSKQAEIAVATYNINPNKAKNVISLPSSPTSYEFTCKMYSVMGLPVENVISDYTTFDLIGDRHNDILKRLKDMKINNVVGNIPYQENLGNDGRNSSKSKSIYHLFFDSVMELEPRYISMIMPSRWMTRSADGIPSKWVDKMLAQNKFKVIHDFENENDCFNGVVIKGGVNYFLWDRDYDGKCEYHFHQTHNNSDIVRYNYLDSKSAGVVIRDSQSHSILEKIELKCGDYYKDENNNFSGLVSPKDFFTRKPLLSSNWTGYKSQKDDVYCIKYYFINSKKDRTHGWISLNQLVKNKSTKDLHKVYIPGAGGKGGDDDLILGNPFYGEPNSVCSQTFMVIGYDVEKHNLSKEECQNIIKYIYTKFFRYLVSIKKKTQNGPRGVYQFVPLQNFTSNSDIDWSKSISEIDQQLYTKYGLTADEIDFIESKIKPM